MYIYIYIYIHIYLYVYIYTHVCVHTCAFHMLNEVYLVTRRKTTSGVVGSDLAREKRPATRGPFLRGDFMRPWNSMG